MTDDHELDDVEGSGVPQRRAPNAAAVAAASRARRMGARRAPSELDTPASATDGSATGTSEVVVDDGADETPVDETPLDETAAADEPVADDEPSSTAKKKSTRASRLRDERAAEKARKKAHADAATATANESSPATTSLRKTTSDSAHAASAPPSERGWAVWVPATVLAAAAVAVAIVLAVTSSGGKGSPAALREKVLAAAKTCVVDANSYSYKDIDSFEKKGLACGTGDFAVQFKQSVDNVVRKAAPGDKQVQALQVNTAGISEVEGSKWTVLIYGQIQVTNTSTGSAGRTDAFGATVTMVDQGGKWLISSQDTLCTQVLIQYGAKCA